MYICVFLVYVFVYWFTYLYRDTYEESCTPHMLSLRPSWLSALWHAEASLLGRSQRRAGTVTSASCTVSVPAHAEMHMHITQRFAGSTRMRRGSWGMLYVFLLISGELNDKPTDKPAWAQPSLHISTHCSQTLPSHVACLQALQVCLACP